MHVARRLGGAALLATLLVAPAWSQEAQPVFGRRNATPYAYPPSYCPPGYPAQPYPVQPGQPGMLPGTVPGAPPTAQPPVAQPGTQPGTQPGAQPGAEQPNAAATPPSTDFGQASAAGSS